MSHRHDDTDPIEHDPTGMRALLGGLPDPGPMPADLVSRIEAALADEAREHHGWAAPPAPEPVGPHSDAVVLPLRRRPRWHLLVAAAGVVGLLGVGGLVLEALAPGGVQASLGVAEDTAGASSADAGGAEQEGAAAPEGALRRVAGDGAMRVEVLASDVDLPSGDLGPAVAAALGAGGGAPAPETLDGTDLGSADRPGVADPVIARACATSLGVRPATAVVVLLTTVDDAPATVLVAPGESAARTAWVVGDDCGRPGVVTPQVSAGPVEVR